MEGGRIQVLVFGSLRDHLARDGLPGQLELAVPEEGRSAASVAEELGIPAAEVEAAFINGRVHGLAAVVRPGDRLALAPYGTPGPYRLFLGMVRPSQGRGRQGDTGPGGKGGGA